MQRSFEELGLGANTAQEWAKRMDGGECILVVGASDGGKTALSNGLKVNCELNKKVGKFLEGHGCATNQENYIHHITEQEIIKDDEIIYRAQKCNIGIFRSKALKVVIEVISDMIISVMGGECKSNEELEKIKYTEIKRILSNKIKNASNDSEMYLIKQCVELEGELLERFETGIGKVPIYEVERLYTEEKLQGKKNNSQIKRRIKEKVEQLVETEWRELIDEAIESYVEMANYIFEELKKNLDKNNVLYSEENGLYIKINLETPKEILKLLFNSENKSIEYIFSKIDIYEKTNEGFINRGYENLKTSQGKFQIQSPDTRGFFHNESESIEDALTRFRELVNRNNPTVIAFVISAEDGIAYKKSIELLCRIKEEISKNLKIVVMLSKIDKLILMAQLDEEDLDDWEESGELIELTKEQTEEIVEAKKIKIKKAFNEVQVSKKNYPELLEVIPYGKPIVNLSKEGIRIIKEKYNRKFALNELMQLTNSIASYNKDKINFRLEEGKWDIGFKVVDKEKMVQEIKTITQEKVRKGSLIQIEENILNEKAKTAHGNSARAGVSNAKFGYSYVSNIDQNWFVNCVNINLAFPGYLNKIGRKWISGERIGKYIEIVNGEFINEEGKKEFYRKLEEFLNKEEFSRKISGEIFKEAIKKHEERGFSSWSRLLKNTLESMYSEFIVDTKYNEGEELTSLYLELVLDSCEILKQRYIRFC